MEKEIECSLITIINDQRIYDEFESNVHTQVGVSYELIPLYNINNERYYSARQALCEGAKKANGEYLIFLHPDIRFLAEDNLKEIFKYIKNIDSFGVVGVAGATESFRNQERLIYSNIVHGMDKRDAGVKISAPIVVQTVDECFFVQKRSIYNKMEFTEKKGWHLYAVEQCLRAKEKGLKNYVVPADVWHISDGKSLNAEYIIDLKDILKEYKYKYKYLYTTVKRWKTRGVCNYLYLVYYYYKQKIKNHLMK